MAVNSACRQKWTGLAAGLVLLIGLEGCSTTTSDQDIRRAALWAAATECARGKALTVDRIDDDGQVHGRFLAGGQQDASAFNACYSQKTKEGLRGAGGASGPAQILQSPPLIDPSAVHPPARLTSVAIQIINNRVLVPVVLNENQPATFLLDTGANITVITPDLARRAAVALPSGALKWKARVASGQEVGVSLIRVKSIRVGLARIENFGVAVYELGVLGGTGTAPLAVDGFLGEDFLGHFTMTVDPRAGTLTLQLAEPPAK
jgi:hypothetical protein